MMLIEASCPSNSAAAVTARIGPRALAVSDWGASDLRVCVIATYLNGKSARAPRAILVSWRG